MGLQVSSVFALFTLAPSVNSITRPHRNVTLRGVGYAPRHSFHLFARSAAKLVFFLSINRSTAVIRRARSVRYFYATADRLGGGSRRRRGRPVSASRIPEVKIHRVPRTAVPRRGRCRKSCKIYLRKI